MFGLMMLLAVLSMVLSKRNHRMRFPFKSGPNLRPKRDALNFKMAPSLSQSADREVQDPYGDFKFSESLRRKFIQA